MANLLDWTSAKGDALDLAPHRARAAEMASRLADEVQNGRLPFFNMPYWDKLADDLAGLRQTLERFDHMLLLGIGGSALGARALQKAFFSGQDMPGHKGPWLWIADNVDAGALDAYMDLLPPEKTVVVTVSKSGGTIETVGQYLIIKEWMFEQLGGAWKDHMLLVTDEKAGFLRQEADEHSIRTLPVPDGLGGRYSVLSAVGLVPAIFLNMDVAQLVTGHQSVAGSLSHPGLSASQMAAHPAFELACWNAALMNAGFDQLIFFSYIPTWACFGDWFAQLWAESLGKGGKGSQPVPAIGVTDQHSVNQMFLDGPRNKACLYLTCPSQPRGPRFPQNVPDKFDYVRGKDFGELIHAEGLGNQMALVQSGVPLVEIRLDTADENAAGRMIALLGAATILCGWLLDINPLDQPAVELGKRLAKARMGADGLDEEKAQLAAFLEADRDQQEF